MKFFLDPYYFLFLYRSYFLKIDLASSTLFSCLVTPFHTLTPVFFFFFPSFSSDYWELFHVSGFYCVSFMPGKLPVQESCCEMLAWASEMERGEERVSGRKGGREEREGGRQGEKWCLRSLRFFLFLLERSFSYLFGSGSVALWA